MSKLGGKLNRVGHSPEIIIIIIIIIIKKGRKKTCDKK
jgi:hypothetical protein